MFEGWGRLIDWLEFVCWLGLVGWLVGRLVGCLGCCLMDREALVGLSRPADKEGVCRLSALYVACFYGWLVGGQPRHEKFGRSGFISTVMVQGSPNKLAQFLPDQIEHL